MSPYSLPDLPYDYAALEPHIDARTMEIHHTEHHRRYVDKLNSVIEKDENLRALGEQPIEDLLWNLGKVPEETRNAIRHAGGGHANHSLFWPQLSPEGGGEPSGTLAEAIAEEFGSFSTFRRYFTTAATHHVGSGWVWLVRARTRLVVYTLPNEDSPLTAEELPIMGLDVWEHAYYLKYQADREAYVDAFWNVVNWDEIGRRFKEAAR